MGEKSIILSFISHKVFMVLGYLFSLIVFHVLKLRYVRFALLHCLIALIVSAWHGTSNLSVISVFFELIA